MSLHLFHFTNVKQKHLGCIVWSRSHRVRVPIDQSQVNLSCQSWVSPFFFKDDHFNIKTKPTGWILCSWPVLQPATDPDVFSLTLSSCHIVPLCLHSLMWTFSFLMVLLCHISGFKYEHHNYEFTSDLAAGENHTRGVSQSCDLTLNKQFCDTIKRIITLSLQCYIERLMHIYTGLLLFLCTRLDRLKRLLLI